jgi:hypothetical protein
VEQKINLEDFIFSSGAAREYTVNRFFQDSILQKEYYTYQFDSSTNNRHYGILYKDTAYLPISRFLTTYTDNFNNSQNNILFVADALKDMKAHHQNYLRTNRFNVNGSKYIELNVVESTINFDSVFIDYLEEFTNIFLNIFLVGDKAQKIVDIHSFIDYFILFIKSIKPIFTKSTFTLGKNTPMAVNGLTVGFDNGNMLDLVSKANVYISDPNFDTFLDSAKRFGFRVDKNAPWSIVADLESPVMKDYQRRYGITNTDDLYKKLYAPVYLYDLEVNRVALISMWNRFARENIYNLKTEKLEGCSKLFSTVTNYSQINEEIFNYHFNLNWQLRLLLFCKVNELDLKITQSNFENIYAELKKDNQYYGLDSALKNLNSRLVNLVRLQQENISNLTNPNILDSIKIELQKNVNRGSIIF